MSRDLNFAEIAVVLGGAGVILGLTVLGTRAFVFGIVILVLAGAAAAYRWNRATEAGRPKRVDFPSAEVARSRIDDAASELALQGTRWEQSGDAWTAVFEADMAGDEGFWIDCSVAVSGRADLQLGSHGIQQETLFGTVPIGPEAPFGADEFLRLIEAIGGDTSLSMIGRQTAPAPMVASPSSQRGGKDDARSPSAPPQRPTRFCHSCGGALGSGERYCPACGTERRERTSSGRARPPNPAADLATEPPEVAPMETSEQPTSADDSTIQSPKGVGHCPLCGSGLLPEAVFCIHCGGTVEGATAWM